MHDGDNGATQAAELESGRESAAEWRENWRRLRLADRDAVPDMLGPPGAFDDTRASAAERAAYGYRIGSGETGPNSRTVTHRLRMSCSDWKRVPGARDFYRAVHTPAGTPEETGMLLRWFHEAGIVEQIRARLEEVYTWRELVRALHREGLTDGEGARRINRFAAQ